MESTVKLFIEEETHGMKVKRHLNWDDLNWVAITPIGSVILYRDRTDWMIYAVYNPKRGRYHVHIPYGEDIFILDERARKVLEEVQQCLHLGMCYIDNGEMIYNINRLRLRGFIPFGIGDHTSNIKKK